MIGDIRKNDMDLNLLKVFVSVANNKSISIAANELKCAQSNVTSRVKQLEKVLKSSFVTNNGLENIVIQGEKTNAHSIQNDIETVKNLSYDAFDRAHRFVRLWNKTTWTIDELDIVLIQLLNS